jgi:Uma2 family endonuclease
MITLIPLTPVTDDDLERLSALNEAYSIERDDEGRLVIEPNWTLGGLRRVEAFMQLNLWHDATKAGGMVFGSSAGFKLSTGAVRAPDASWLSQERIDTVDPALLTGFWPVCPDVTIEVAAQSSDWKSVLAKIESYRREGARYAVAIDPETRRTVELGEPPAGLILDFDAIIDV